MPKFKQAPLPFIGQKRNFLNAVEKVLIEHISDNGDGWIIIDVFGGSGLLAHTAKQLMPKARVIYNDFDNYSERLLHIDDTNRLRRQIYDVVAELPKNKRLDKSKKEQIIQIIKQFTGFVDLNCLSSWLLFSGSQVSSLEQLYKLDFWHSVRKTDYPTAKGYLDGLEIRHQSFHQLLPEFENQEKVLLMLDPPYLCTKQESYRQKSYFDLIDFLRLIHLTKPPYLFFSSTKSEFVRFIDYLVEDKKDNWQSFVNIERVTFNAALNYQSSYEDNLIYKF